ncbi:MAG: hypothetical protein IJ242_13940 [Clostridia bacterium]|nr:hypothetical protein [Clostridia bacterium]
MENKLFREKSVERISSPEQLNDYLHVTSPGIWILLIAVIVLLAGLFLWSTQASIESFIEGNGTASSGVLTVSFETSASEPVLENGMIITVGNHQVPISFVGRDADGSLIAGGDTDLPDGIYTARVGYNRTQLLKLLFN